MTAPDKKITGIIYLFITIMLFSTFEVTSKILGRCMHPVQITSSRFLIGGLVLLPLCLYTIKKNRLKLNPADYMYIGLLGFINIVVSMGLIQLGLVYANASVSAALFSINPLFVVIFSRIILDEKITVSKILGLALGSAGVFILFIDSVQGKTSTLYGLVLILAAAVTFALYTVLGKKVTSRNNLGSLVVTTISFLAGSVMLIPLQAALGIPLIPDAGSVLPYLMYMSIGVTGMAYVFYFEGLSRTGAGSGSMMYFAKPALASVLAVIVLHESVSISLAAGIAVIAAGIFCSQFGSVRTGSSE